MKKIWYKLIALISISVLCISGCTVHDPNLADNDEEINTTQAINTSATDTPAADTAATDTSAIDTQLETVDNYGFGTPVAGIDLNYDGITEDFFIGKDEYGDDEYIIVMYDNEKGTFDDIDISRTETIDLYRENYAAPNEPPDYRYWFTYVCGFGINKSIHYSNIYTGYENEKALVGTHYGYYKKLASRISYHLTDEKGFDELMNDPHTFFEKHRNFEFVESISLEERINADCKQAYLSSIKVADETPEIEIYSLENDVFGKKYKFTNGKYSYFTDAFNDVEIYERYADLAVPTNEYNHYDTVPRGEKDYLICLKNSNQEAVAFLYLGTASEGYLFQYGADRDQYKSYRENPEHSYKTFLKDDGWLFVKQIEIVRDEKQELIGTLDLVQDSSRIFHLELPKDKVDIDKLKDYPDIAIKY